LRAVIVLRKKKKTVRNVKPLKGSRKHSSQRVKVRFPNRQQNEEPKEDLGARVHLLLEEKGDARSKKIEKKENNRKSKVGL